MAHLLIDNSVVEKIVFFYYSNTAWQERSFSITEVSSVLGAIDKLLIELGTDVSELRGVAVIVGKGRFTATRIATTIANTLAYALSIPAVAIFATTPRADIKKYFEAQRIGQYILPRYSGEATIGKKK